CSQFYTHRYTRANFSSDPQVPAGNSRNIAGVCNAGDFNNDGDLELAVIITQRLDRGTSAFIVDLPPVLEPNCPCAILASGYQSVPSEVFDLTLFAIHGETGPVVSDGPHPEMGDSDYYSPLVFPGRGGGYQTMHVEPGWDFDGDGKNDLVVRAGFFSAPVTQVYSSMGMFNVCVPPVGPEQYFVDAGRDYVVLSPPAAPELVSTSISATNATITVKARKFVPPHAPFDEFPFGSILYKVNNQSFPATAAVTLPRDSSGITELIVSFSGLPQNPQGGKLLIPTRHHGTWTISIP
ncbi:MAG: hypothetical protein H7210_03515, partial [Pyrinomonadaceae bacterium]|nr:hypothetical protein [Phycisphaerales bacterium]